MDLQQMIAQMTTDLTVIGEYGTDTVGDLAVIAEHIAAIRAESERARVLNSRTRLVRVSTTDIRCWELTLDGDTVGYIVRGNDDRFRIAFDGDVDDTFVAPNTLGEAFTVAQNHFTSWVIDNTPTAV